MKNRIFLCAVVLFSYYSFSQSYTQGVDEKLQLLDKSEITTHILYDRVYPMAHLQVSPSISEKKMLYGIQTFKNNTIFVLK